MTVARAVAVLLTAFAGAAFVSTAGAGGRDQWAALHRPLALPRVAHGAACPVSSVDRTVKWSSIDIFGRSGTGLGPVYPGLGATSGRVSMTPDEQYGGPWFGEKVFWFVKPTYRGPVLVRGRRLDGAGRLGFNGTKAAGTELRIAAGDTVSWHGQPRGSRGVPTEVRALVPGCYGVQIDGTTFSRIVVFTVDLAR